MVPALYPGDRLLARRVKPAAKVRNGTLALVTWSHYPGLVAVKRVIRPDPPGYWVEGDNPYASQDSRSYGPATVRAVVLVRFWPWPPRRPATLRR